MARETAVERRAREAQEARQAQAAWRQALPMRVLEDMARAHMLGVQSWVCYTKDMIIVFFQSVDSDIGEYTVTIGPETCTAEWEYTVGSMLDQVQIQLDQKLRQEEMRKHALSKLTTEEREALGL